MPSSILVVCVCVCERERERKRMREEENEREYRVEWGLINRMFGLRYWQCLGAL